MIHNHCVDKNRQMEKLPRKSITAAQISHYHPLSQALAKLIEFPEGFELS